MQLCKESVANTAVTYRPDVDGLRAVAVMGVVAYHLGAFRAHGGFVGVDVFFVISGYLISSVILRDLEQSRFSLRAFYERRIRRILPALVVMMMITAFVCSYYQLPSQLPGTALSLIAATFSASNIYFLLATAYFPNYRSEPFSPTWSLAVEEQFYIFFPLFLILARRYLPGRLKTVVITVAAVSFVLSAFGVYLFPWATFFLPITRAWELLLGTMLAMDVFPRIDSVLLRNVLPLTGLAGILFCVFTYSPSLPFPGVAALAPCLGAALIIAAGETGKSLVGRVLSLKPVVFLGLISYSLYLWHVPVMMFQRFGIVQISNASNHVVKGATLVVSILVATLSWKFIETPFRTGRLMLKGRSAFAFAAVSAVMLTVLGVTLVALHGLSLRYTHRQLALSSYTGNALPGRSGSRFIESGGVASKPHDPGNCLHQDPSRKNYLFTADRDAAQLWYGLHKVFPNIKFMQATTSGCESLIAVQAGLPARRAP
jgi:peptidoglycan/LPS O-acetylase OafA/YrhL